MHWILQNKEFEFQDSFSQTWRLFAAKRLWFRGYSLKIERKKVMSKCWNLIKAYFSCLNLSVPVSVKVFIIKLQCANKTLMFGFSPYLISQDKVEINVLQEICDRIHTYTHSSRERGYYILIFVLFIVRPHRQSTQSFLIKCTCPQI